MFQTIEIVVLVLVSIARCVEPNDYEARLFPRSAVFPSQQTMDGWASDLDLTFKRLTNGETDITGASQFQYKYQNSVDENPGFEIAHANAEEILLNMTNKISNIFDDNIVALKNLQQSAESLVQAYTYSEDLTLGEVTYTNVNDLGNVSELLTYSNHFKQDIHDATSGVHIPIEIYEGYNSNQMSRICPTCASVCDLCENGLFWRQDSNYGYSNINLVKDPEILNGINWSEDLTEVFKKNAQQFPKIYWQSFASREGYLRVYPTARWPIVDGQPDLYDVRRRPWYIHGISSPKDVIILLDTSGSMHGQSFDIMKLAAKTLLNTLGENDYVNVARFAKNVTWVTPCLNTLVQANARNKRLLFDGIDALVDHHVASYSKALEFAYTAFEDFEGTRSPQEGADCHKLIMVFSDGGTEYPSKIIKVFSNATREITKHVRIFSYAVGPHPLPTVALKKMACDTGGAFTTITAMGAIRTKIQDYVRVLSKPLALIKPENFMPSTFSVDYLGLGFTTTITLPVFNTSTKSNQQTLAGVVGIDIPVFTFKNLTPRRKLGPFGYSFGINSNGFIIWHPDLWTVANYLEDPAHNDFADVESESADLTKLREEMVEFAHDRGEGHMKKDLSVALIMQEGHAIKVKKEYHYGSVRGTSFAVGVVVPKGWDYIKIPVQSNGDTELSSLNLEGTLLAPWKICDETKSEQDSDSDTIEGIIQKIKNKQCHGEDLDHLIWDAKISREVFEGLKPVGVDSDHISRFVVTDGGLTMFKPQRALEEFKVLNSDPYNSTLYKFAIASSTPVIFIQTFSKKEVIPLYHVTTSAEEMERDDDEEPISSELASKTVSDRAKDKKVTGGTKTTKHAQPTIVMRSPKETTLHLAQAFRVAKGGNNFSAGVAGVRISASYVQQLLLDHSPSPVGELSCRNYTDIRCYFIDHSGFILASNQPLAEVAAGDFLGQVDEQIMEHLVKNGFFYERAEFNYQALCPSPIDCTTASSTILRSMFGSVFNVIFTLVSRIINFVHHLNIGIMSLLASLYLPIEEVVAVSEYGYRIPEGLHRCTTKTSNWYLREDSPVLYRDRVVTTCDGNQCARNFHLYRMENVNGILIVADYKCNFCKGKVYFDGPVEVEDVEDCLLPKRYRRRPEECFANHDKEVYECSSAKAIYTMNILILVSMVISQKIV